MFFCSSQPYLIRIYIDDVNVITGQTTQDQDNQDYFVVPEQEFVNGHKPDPTTLPIQFCCHRFQLYATKRSFMNIRFEITPHMDNRYMQLQMFDDDSDNQQTFSVLPTITVKDLKDKYNLQFEEVPSSETKLYHRGWKLNGKIQSHLQKFWLNWLQMLDRWVTME